MQRLFNISLPVVTVALLVVGTYYGLVVAPPEVYMGEIYRIIYVHVPAAWMTFVAYIVAFIAGLIYLFRQNAKADAIAEASVEVGLVFNIVALCTGAIWAKPTWGVYWTWDPRLTTFAILFFAYIGYMALRRFVDDGERRATWSAIAGIIIAVDMPIVWFSVKWWATLHQTQSSPKTMDPEMVVALRLCSFAFLGVYLLFVRMRYRLARLAQRDQLGEPPMPSAVQAAATEAR